MGAQLAHQAFSRGSGTDCERRESPFEVDADANGIPSAGVTYGLRQERELLRHAHCWRPEGRLVTDTSEPCGHRLSGDEAGCRRTCERAMR